MLLNAHIPNDFQIVGWLKRGIKRERNQIEREDERSAGRGGEGVQRRTDLGHHASPAITRTEGIQASLCQRSLYAHTPYTPYTFHFWVLVPSKNS